MFRQYPTKPYRNASLVSMNINVCFFYSFLDHLSQLTFTGFEHQIQNCHNFLYSTQNWVILVALETLSCLLSSPEVTEFINVYLKIYKFLKLVCLICPLNEFPMNHDLWPIYTNVHNTSYYISPGIHVVTKHVAICWLGMTCGIHKAPLYILNIPCLKALDQPNNFRNRHITKKAA